LIRSEFPDPEEDFQATYGAGVLRSDVVDWGSDVPRSPKAAADPQRVKSVLPAGKTYEVSANGGFVACLREKGFGPNRRLHVAYVFEMRYLRSIESNNGRRIVERRCFQEVRMAKIVSPVADMRLRLDDPDRPVLDGLRFPGPASGIVVAPVHSVASAMLSHGVDSAAADPCSRAFLEHDALSGRTARLTFVDGQGVVSVEPIGWTLTSSAARFLLSQPVLHKTLIPSQDSGEDAVCTIDLGHLASFLDPSLAPCCETDVLVELAGTRHAHYDRYSLSQVWDDDSDTHVDNDDDQHCVASTPLGALQYDRNDGIVTAAIVNWPLSDLDLRRDRLLYERWNQFQDAPVLSVRYQCRTH